GLDDEIDEGSPHRIVGDEAQADRRLVGGELAEGLDDVEGQRPRGIEGVAIGVAVRNGVMELARRRGAPGQLDVRGELRLRLFRDAREGAGRRRQGAVVALGGTGEQEILERATEAEMELAEIRIERAEVSAKVRAEVDAGRAEPEQPRLAVVRVRAED